MTGSPLLGRLCSKSGRHFIRRYSSGKGAKASVRSAITT